MSAALIASKVNPGVLSVRAIGDSHKYRTTPSMGGTIGDMSLDFLLADNVWLTAGCVNQTSVANRSRDIPTSTCTRPLGGSPILMRIIIRIPA
jgi:hypothetical protein